MRVRRGKQRLAWLAFLRGAIRACPLAITIAGHSIRNIGAGEVAAGKDPGFVGVGTVEQRQPIGLPAGHLIAIRGSDMPWPMRSTMCETTGVGEHRGNLDGTRIPSLHESQVMRSTGENRTEAPQSVGQQKRPFGVFALNAMLASTLASEAFFSATRFGMLPATRLSLTLARPAIVHTVSTAISLPSHPPAARLNLVCGVPKRGSEPKNVRCSTQSLTADWLLFALLWRTQGTLSSIEGEASRCDLVSVGCERASTWLQS